MSATDSLRRLAKPIPDGEKLVDTIDRLARLIGLKYSRCYEIYYRRARRIEPEEVARIEIALDKKLRLETRNEVHELRTRMAIIEARLAHQDEEFHRPTLAAMRSVPNRSR